MAKIKKFQILRVPVEVEYHRPLLGRIISLYALVKCSKLFRLESYGHKYYMLAIPKIEVT